MARHHALFVVLAWSAGIAHCQAQEKLYVATPLTKDKEFTPGIEGPACDKAGNVYAVNFARQQTIGKVTPDGKGEVWLELPGKTTGTAIVSAKQVFRTLPTYSPHKARKVNPQ